MTRILSLVCRAQIETDLDEIEEARRSADSGDQSWERWLGEYEEGLALLLRVTLSAEFDGLGGAGEALAAPRRVWVEKSVHPPLVARQLQEVVSSHLVPLEEQLSAVGSQQFPADLLAGFYVRVELGDDVLRSLAELDEAADTPPPLAGPCAL